MCGRFIIDGQALESAASIAPVPAWIQEELEFKTVYPSQKSLVLKEDVTADLNHPEIQADLLPFGFHSDWLKKRMINARADSVLTKPMYARAARTGRCVVVASQFYEWTKDKEPWLFSLPGQTLFMAGLVIDGGFVIITTGANASVQDIHHRMPVIFNKEQAVEWLKDSRKTKELLHLHSVMLESRPAFSRPETLTLF